MRSTKVIQIKGNCFRISVEKGWHVAGDEVVIKIKEKIKTKKKEKKNESNKRR